MNVMDVKVKQGRVEAEPAEVLVLTHYEGDSSLPEEAAVVDKALHGALRDLLKSGEFQGKSQQTVLLHTQGRIRANRVLLVGLGKKQDARLDTVRQAMGSAAKRVRQAGVRSFATPVHGLTLPRTSRVDLAQAMVEGAILGCYQFILYRSESNSEPKDLNRMTVVVTRAQQLSEIKEGIRRGLASAEATVFVRDLCNHPSNVMTPARIAAEAKAIGKEHGVRVKILEQRDAEKLGMGAFL
ncbi:MAG TPA: M17 family peptidase N-terminal domain-containing protein, partial [Nitrospiraceae bacterium]|nr:M17 family peptidase N-terminal domain-containing protein [Nitrospiraceae bacterium]